MTPGKPFIFTTALVPRIRALNALGWTRSEIAKRTGYPKALLTLWLPDEPPGVARQEAEFLRVMALPDPDQPGARGEGTYP